VIKPTNLHLCESRYHFSKDGLTDFPELDQCAYFSKIYKIGKYAQMNESGKSVRYYPFLDKICVLA
jgi:hypothetical protein